MRGGKGGGVGQITIGNRPAARPGAACGAVARAAGGLTARRAGRGYTRASWKKVCCPPSTGCSRCWPCRPSGCQPFSRSRWCPRPCCRSVPSRRCSATSSWRRTCSGRPCWWRRWAIPSAARSAMPWGWPPNARCSAGRKTPPSPRVPSRCRAGRPHARPLEPARARLAAPHGSAGAAAVLAAGRGRPAVRRGRVAAAVILPCVAYMAIGKFLRYVAMTAGLLWFFRGSSDASDLSENKGTYQ